MGTPKMTYIKDDEKLQHGASLRPDLIGIGEQIEEVTYGDCKAGDVVCGNDGYPAKVKEARFTKTGKHGAAKATLTIQGIFTGKSEQLQNNQGKAIKKPEVSKKDFEVYDYMENEVSCLNEDTGDIVTYRLHEETPLGQVVREKLDNEEKVTLTLLEGQCMVNNEPNKVHYLTMA